MPKRNTNTAILLQNDLSRMPLKKMSPRMHLPCLLKPTKKAAPTAREHCLPKRPRSKESALSMQTAGICISVHFPMMSNYRRKIRFHTKTIPTLPKFRSPHFRARIPVGAKSPLIKCFVTKNRTASSILSRFMTLIPSTVERLPFTATRMILTASLSPKTLLP